MTTEREAALDRLLRSHEQKLGEVQAIARRHPRSTLLRQLSTTAGAGLRAIEATRKRPQLDPPYSSLGWWGDNGVGPRVRDLHSQARFFDKMENCP